MTVAGMKYSLIPRENKVLIYQYLINGELHFMTLLTYYFVGSLHGRAEGVLVCQKSPKIPVHPHINVPNLHVMMTMKSLKSRNYVIEHYNWQHLYFVLTDQGIEYLRNFLYLPPTVFPATHSKKTASKVLLKQGA